MKLPDIFSSKKSLQNAFELGLQRQLDEPSLGTFILVLANAVFDEKIFPILRRQLLEKFEQLSKQYSDTIRLGKKIDDAPDDVLVFLKLIAMGFNNLNATEYRHTDQWELQFNQLRSLRPQRMSGTTISTLTAEFDEQGFHFNKPFLKKEVFWQGDIEGTAVKLLYNKFPFARLHGLLVPEPEQKLPQFLTKTMHEFVSKLCKEIGRNISDIAIAFNGYGAGASINHLHFQTFVRQNPLPVLNNHWQHNGGSKTYPSSCFIFKNNQDAWEFIESLHRHNTPYNLLYLPERIVCLPRKFQGSFDVPHWTESFAWYELCGGITTFNKEDFLQLDDVTISRALDQLK